MQNLKNYLFVILLSPLTSAQIGINTTSPSATLDIVSKGNTNATKALKISDSTTPVSNELVTILDNGNVGVNKSNPSGKVHIVGNASTNDVLYLENLQGGDALTGYSNLLINNTTGKVIKSTGVSTVMTNYKSSTPQALDQTSTSGQLITFLSTDNQISTATTFNQTTSTFTILENGVYMISGFIGFNAFRPDFSTATQYVAVNLYFEYSTNGGTSWSQLTGIRSTFVGIAAGTGTAIQIPSTIASLSANTMIRFIIQRPGLIINGVSNGTFGAAGAGNGHINLPSGQSYTKSVLFLKL